MAPDESSTRPPHPSPFGRPATAGKRRGGRSDRGAESPFRAFRRPGVWTLAAAVGLVVGTGIITSRATRSRDPAPDPDRGAFQALRETPLDAPAPVRGGAPGAPAEAAPFPPPDRLDGPARAALGVVEEVERGRAEGATSVARKRFDPCPGEDVERLAWIDDASRVVKLTGTREGAPPVRVEAWYDREGRLRGVRAARGGEGAFTLHALFDERGDAVLRASTGPAPALEDLRIAREDPSGAFFEAPRCEPGTR